MAQAAHEVQLRRLFILSGRARMVALSAAFTVVYCALDRLGSVFSPEAAATPWDLAGGLALALLVLEGPWYALLVGAADVLSSTLAPGPPHSLARMLGEAGSLSVFYGAAAVALRRAGALRLAAQTDLLRFTLVVTIAGAVRAGVDSLIAPDSALGWQLADFIRHWAGAVVGAVVLSPLIMGLRPPTNWPAAGRIAEGFVLGVLLVALMVYTLPPRGDDPFGLFYLLFLPQIWIAVRFGVTGAILGNLTVQSGLIAYLLLGHESGAAVFNFQFRLLALALSALFLGVAVSERRRTEAALRQRQEDLARVSRLSLAGEMAGALAHELNQPLLAIMAFGRTAQRLADQPTARARFNAAIDGVVSQADRAGGIVKSLRRFMDRSESARGAHAPEQLVRDAVAFAEPQAARQSVRIVQALDRGLPQVWVDPVQVQQVVLNLVQNAVASLARAEAAARTITISAATAAEEGVEIEVRDSGPGVAREVVERLFGPFAGNRPGGMGLGLLISRGIIEGHGGRLWLAHNEPGACAFRFTLPSAD